MVILLLKETADTMMAFLKSKVHNIYFSTPCRCIGIHFGDYSNPFEEAAEESMVTVTLSRSQLWHYGDPFKKQWRYYNDPFENQQRRNFIAIIVRQMIQLLGRHFLKASGGSDPSPNQQRLNLISTIRKTYYLD